MTGTRKRWSLAQNTSSPQKAIETERVSQPWEGFQENPRRIVKEDLFVSVGKGGGRRELPRLSDLLKRQGQNLNKWVFWPLQEMETLVLEQFSFPCEIHPPLAGIFLTMLFLLDPFQFNAGVQGMRREKSDSLEPLRGRTIC